MSVADQFLHALVRTERIGVPLLFLNDSGEAARAFIRSLLCVGTKEKQCDCVNCRKFLSGSYLDYVEIDSAKIEDLREFVRFFGYRPREGSWRVGLIQNADAMTGASLDTLLKLLEEPPDHSLFILMARAMPRATIKSRCFCVPFFVGQAPTASGIRLLILAKAFGLDTLNVGVDIDGAILLQELLEVLGQLQGYENVRIGKIVFDLRVRERFLLVFEKAIEYLKAGVKPILVVKMIEGELWEV